MSTQNDWITLKKTIAEYKGIVSETWGFITPENAKTLVTRKCQNKNLFEFLLDHNHFECANTIAYIIPLFDDTNIELIYHYHHLKYVELIKILCMDYMILLYEDYRNGINDLDTEIDFIQMTGTNIKTDIDQTYRIAISKRYEKMLLNENSEGTITELITEFKFLTHPYLNDFYKFLSNSNELHRDNDLVIQFCVIYKKYLSIQPLMYHVINEFYLEYIKHQLRTIEDMHENSFIILSEQYDTLKETLMVLPKSYIDYRYQDNIGNNILTYMATLPYLSDTCNREIYQEIFKGIQTCPIELKNSDGNTIFHVIAEYENEIFLEVFIQWLFSEINVFNDNSIDSSINEIKSMINELVIMENASGQTMYDILLSKQNFRMIFMIIEFVPSKIYLKITNKLIENFEIIDKLPDRQQVQKIYTNCLNYFMDVLLNLKQNVICDLNAYSETKSKAIKLIDKCVRQINLDSDHYLEWLSICIKINEFDLFQMILSKYFINDQSSINTQYLNRLLHTETLIISAIKQQNIKFIKALLNYDIDLSISDKSTNKNAIIIAMETKNLYILKLLREHIQRSPEHSDMASIMNYFIEFIEKNNTLNTFSFYNIWICLWNTIEYFINYFKAS
jgi:hypothetical protein